MKVIGLTGGIGTGKSTVTEYLRDRGFYVIDADGISHSITAKGSPVLDNVRDAFGGEYFTSDGELDRKKMAALVFKDPCKKALLESIITTEVLAQTEKEIERLRDAGCEKIVFLDAPLLFESGADEMTDFVWLITADEEVRIERVMKRDKCSRDAVLERMRNQMSCEEKAARSSELINNSRGKEELYGQIEGLIKKYADR